MIEKQGFSPSPLHPRVVHISFDKQIGRGVLRPMLELLRHSFHTSILQHILGLRDGGYYSNADKGNNLSRSIAANLAQKLIDATGVAACAHPPNGQTAGTLFCEYTRAFLEQAFQLIHHLRPGAWIFTTEQGPLGIAGYEQYHHLAELQQICEQHPELEAAVGTDYLIKPDIVVGRQPVADADINAHQVILPQGTALAHRTPFRLAVNATTILHASVSCKWTMRSDRGQNTRTEALNLIRNRKGKNPHIVAVTFEPMPSRLASIAMGTGDIDCTYHGALPELIASVAQAQAEDAQEILNILAEGRRLRDISDLPFDLAV